MPLTNTVASVQPGGKFQTGAEVKALVDQFATGRNTVRPFSMLRNCTSGTSPGESWELPSEPPEMPRNWDPVTTRLPPRPSGEVAAVICGRQELLKFRPASYNSVLAG